MECKLMNIYNENLTPANSGSKLEITSNLIKRVCQIRAVERTWSTGHRDSEFIILWNFLETYSIRDDAIMSPSSIPGK